MYVSRALATTVIYINLMVNPGISNNDKSGLLVSRLDLIGKCSWSESSSNGLSSSVLRELKDGALSVRSGRHNTHISWVLNCNNDSRSKLDFLVGLSEVNDVNA